MLKNTKKTYFMRKIPKNLCFSENSTPPPQPTPSTIFGPLEGVKTSPSHTHAHVCLLLK